MLIGILKNQTANRQREQKYRNMDINRIERRKRLHENHVELNANL